MQRDDFNWISRDEILTERLENCIIKILSVRFTIHKYCMIVCHKYYIRLQNWETRLIERFEENYDKVWTR